MRINVTTLSCPHCQAVFAKDYLAASVASGPATRTCQSCGQQFMDPRATENPLKEKAKELAALVIAVAVLLGLIGVAVVFF